MRDSRLWQDLLACPYVLEGDLALSSQWLGFAKGALGHMLRSTSGPLSATYAPVQDVLIRVDTRPNRIYIRAGSSSTEGVLFYPRDDDEVFANALIDYRDGIKVNRNVEQVSGNCYWSNGLEGSERVIISWDGPWGFQIGPQVRRAYASTFSPARAFSSLERTRLLTGYRTRLNGTILPITYDRWSPNIYAGGEVIDSAPHLVIGAGMIGATLIAVCSLQNRVYAASSVYGEVYYKHDGGWLSAGAIDLAGAGITPCVAHNVFSFSADGTQAITLAAPVNVEAVFIIRLALAIDEDGHVSFTQSVTTPVSNYHRVSHSFGGEPPESDVTYDPDPFPAKDGPVTGPPYTHWLTEWSYTETSTTSPFSYTFHSSLILDEFPFFVGFKGNTEVVAVVSAEGSNSGAKSFGGVSTQTYTVPAMASSLSEAVLTNSEWSYSATTSVDSALNCTLTIPGQTPIVIATGSFSGGRTYSDTTEGESNSESFERNTFERVPLFADLNSDTYSFFTLATDREVTLVNPTLSETLAHYVGIEAVLGDTTQVLTTDTLNYAVETSAISIGGDTFQGDQLGGLYFLGSPYVGRPPNSVFIGRTGLSELTLEAIAEPLVMGCSIAEFVAVTNHQLINENYNTNIITLQSLEYINRLPGGTIETLLGHEETSDFRLSYQGKNKGVGFVGKRLLAKDSALALAKEINKRRVAAGGVPLVIVRRGPVYDAALAHSEYCAVVTQGANHDNAAARLTILSEQYNGFVIDSGLGGTGSGSETLSFPGSPVGSVFSAYGENVNAYPSYSKIAFADYWQASSEHWSAIIDPNYTHTTMAVYIDPASGWAGATQIFWRYY